MYPCGTTIESRTHIVEKCEIHKEERGALEEEMRKLDVCDMEESDQRVARKREIDGGRRQRNRRGVG